MVSAFGREEVMREAEMAGVTGFLIKPVSASLLYETLLQQLGLDPAGPDRPPAALQPEPANLPEHLRGARVLLVEDHPLNRQVASELLDQAGLVVAFAENGRQAVERVRQAAWDLVLMDVQMPVMDGYEATAVIRGYPQLQDLPIVAMTAHAMRGAQEDCLAAGMNDFISKPIDPHELFRVLARWIPQRRPQPAATPAAAPPAPAGSALLPELRRCTGPWSRSSPRNSWTRATGSGPWPPTAAPRRPIAWPIPSRARPATFQPSASGPWRLPWKPCSSRWKAPFPPACWRTSTGRCGKSPNPRGS